MIQSNNVGGLIVPFAKNYHEARFIKTGWY